MSDAEGFLADARKSFRVAAQRHEQLQENRQQKRRALDELKSSAINALEHRGYAVRGKTPSQIREVLRHRPTNPPAERPE